MTSKTDDSAESETLSSRLGPGFDPAETLARMKHENQAVPSNDDDLEASVAPEHRRNYEQLNVAQEAMAASQGAGTFKSEKGNTRIFATNERNGDFSMSNFGGPLTDLNGLTREELKEEQEKEEFDSAMSEIAEQRERERQEWQRTEHSYAGVTLTGEQWEDLADEIRNDTPTRRRIIDKEKKSGKTQAQAEKTANDVSLLSRMQSVPKNQWTPEMKALDEELNADPERRKTLDVYVQDAKEFKFAKALNPGQARKEQVSADASSPVSVDQGADLLAVYVEDGSTKTTAAPAKASKEDPKDTAFPSAPDLGKHYGVALAATEPLDAQKPPVQVAAVKPAPMPAASGGFDV